MASPSPPSVARLLAAGQKGEVLNAEPIYGPLYAASVSEKGRGLLTSRAVSKGDLLLLEPALASGASYAGLAAQLRRIVEKEGGGDGLLLRQLLNLSYWGQAPTGVAAVEESGGQAEGYMRRQQPPCQDLAEYESAKLLLDGVSGEHDAQSASPFGERLERHLELVARGNAFNSPTDALGSLAWHALAPKAQRALADADPSKVPVPHYWLFLHTSLMNHAETANATWLVAGSVIMIRAARDLVAGEEILLSYWPDIDAQDAVQHGLLDGYGMTCKSIGGDHVPELTLSEEDRQALVEVKRLPNLSAARLAASAARGDPAAAFDEVSAWLSEQISNAEKRLPKDLRAFLEPRFLLSQLILQRAAIQTARGDEGVGKVLRLQSLDLAREAFARAERGPWGRRELLRLLYGLHGVLRPAPAALLMASIRGGGEAADGEAPADFAIELAKQARFSPEELRPQLEKAIGDVFGDVALLDPVLTKCGVAE